MEGNQNHHSSTPERKSTADSLQLYDAQEGFSDAEPGSKPEGSVAPAGALQETEVWDFGDSQLPASCPTPVDAGAFGGDGSAREDACRQTRETAGSQAFHTDALSSTTPARHSSDYHGGGRANQPSGSALDQETNIPGEEPLFIGDKREIRGSNSRSESGAATVGEDCEELRSENGVRATSVSLDVQTVRSLLLVEEERTRLRKRPELPEFQRKTSAGKQEEAEREAGGQGRRATPTRDGGPPTERKGDNSGLPSAQLPGDAAPATNATYQGETPPSPWSASFRTDRHHVASIAPIKSVGRPIVPEPPNHGNSPERESWRPRDNIAGDPFHKSPERNVGEGAGHQRENASNTENAAREASAVKELGESLSAFKQRLLSTGNECTESIHALLEKIKEQREETRFYRLGVATVHSGNRASYGGLYQHLTGYTTQEVEAIRALLHGNLHNTAAEHFIRELSNQGFRTGHVVVYFHDPSHRRSDILEFVAKFHTGCAHCDPILQQYAT